MWKDAVTAYFELMSKDFPGRIGGWGGDCINCKIVFMWTEDFNQGHLEL
jgi:hypothetical protein